jgi:hypothetical protein
VIMFLVKKSFEFESGSGSEDHESMGYQLLKPILRLAQQLELSSARLWNMCQQVRNPVQFSPDVLTPKWVDCGSRYF